MHERPNRVVEQLSTECALVVRAIFFNFFFFFFFFFLNAHFARMRETEAQRTIGATSNTSAHAPTTANASFSGFIALRTIALTPNCTARLPTSSMSGTTRFSHVDDATCAFTSIVTHSNSSSRSSSNDPLIVALLLLDLLLSGRFICEDDLMSSMSPARP
jgi:hypothetical protein